MVEQFVRDSRTLKAWVALAAAVSLAAALAGCSSGDSGPGDDAAQLAAPVAAEPVAAEPVPAEPDAAVEEPPVDGAESAGSETVAAVDQPVVEKAHVDAPAGLIVGLDGAEYPAYAEDLILEVKRALTDRELYRGILDGVLDDSTMAAIARFQQMNELHPSGVPSPQTRELLTAGTAKVAVEGSPSSG